MARSKPLVAGNWKMNGLAAQLGELEAIAAGARRYPGVDVAVCPPATLINRAVAAIAGSPVILGGQDCHPAASGAHTGDISAPMLADAGAKAVIVGHSERRANHGETDALVRSKAEAGWRAGLTVILCVGETRAEREAGRALAVIATQLAGSVPDAATAANMVVAYEPVWAIGTGLVATPGDIAEAHAHIRRALVARFGPKAAEIGILYGGSVKPDNAGAVFAAGDVDGALVGGASLKASDFLAIIAAAA
jgi:triosephosphate isomerase